MSFFVMDGQITFITWDQRMITDPFVMEDPDFQEKDYKHAALFSA